jgi:hypothetical protein
MTTELLLIVLAIMLIALSIFFGLKMLRIYRKRSASASWPAINGTVLSREVTSSKNSGSSGYSYRAEVTYSYGAPGGPYKKKLFLGSKGLREQADKLLDNVGDTIPVRYNPEKPAEHISQHEKIMPVDVLAAMGSMILAVILIVLAFI